jgi:hypothetical protein
MQQIKDKNTKPESRKNNNKLTLLIAWMITLIASIAYISTEWLFMISKPSSMSATSNFEKVVIPIFSIALLTFLGCFIVTLIYLPFHRSTNQQSWGLRLLMLVPALILSVTVLLLIDNLTYTTMAIGVITSRGSYRIIYAIGFIALVAYFVYDLNNLSRIFHKSCIINNYKGRNPILLVFTGTLSLITIAVFIVGALQKSPSRLGVIELSNRKNVILITADGLNAEQMSIYGYEKDTTPYLKSNLSEALIAQNNFSNSGATAGSLTSVLTGKHPTSTRVLYRPDILRGDDSYQSLPAILKSAGYYTAQYSFGFYADAYQLNFKNAFDYVNGRSARANNVFGIANLPLPTNYEYFLYELQNRLLPRLRHIFLNELMENEFQQVTDPTKFSGAFNDREKFEDAISLLSETSQPVFLHIHWMKSHGPLFNPRNRVFSAALDDSNENRSDTLYYEDVILDFDEDLRLFSEKLEESGKLEDTLIIIGSDHAKGFVTTRRIPLIYFFPNSEYSGKIVVDTQNLDIAPTVLDYLGLEIPNWMVGQSLLKPLEVYRPIYGVQLQHRAKNEIGGTVLDEQFNNPPFFQFDIIGIENCGNWTQLDLEDFTWSSLPIAAYKSTCSPDDILDSNEIYNSIVQRLKQDGFEFDETQIPLPQFRSKH